MSFSVNYIAVDNDSICENGVHYSVYKKAYRNLAAPELKRFGKQVSNQAIKFNVRVKGLKAIKDSITCQKPLDDKNVLIKKAAWLKFKNSSRD
jgi:hypothetical protein